MLSAGAAESDGEVALALAEVVRDKVGEAAFDAAQELTGLREGPDVLTHFRILAVVRPQPRNKMRVGQKTHIKDQVRIRRHAIAVAKADHGYQQWAHVRILKARGNEVAKFVHFELLGIDDYIGHFANGLHQPALMA